MTTPRAGLRIATLTCVLCTPSLFFGLAADDYELAAQVRADPLSAYAFQARDPAQRAAALLSARARGEVPWWIDPQFHQAFMRPLTSLTLAADFHFWPEATWWMHLENVALVAALVLLAFGFYRHLLADQASAGLATFFYALNPALAISAGWLSARNTLLSTCLGLLSLRLSQRARAEPSRRLWLAAGSVLAFAGSLLSAEIGASTFAFLVAHEVVLERGSPRARLARLAPYLALALSWRLVYRAAGFGSFASAYYRDPSADPIGFFMYLLAATPTYLASTLTMPFAGATIFSMRALWLTALAAALILLMLRPLFAPLVRSDARARFLALASLLAIVPLGATLPQDRLSLFIALATSGLLALLVQQRFAPDCALPRAGARRLFRMRALWAPACFVPALFISFGGAAGGGGSLLERTLSADAAGAALLVNAPSFLPVHYFHVMRATRGGPASAASTPPAVALLYGGTEPVRVHARSERVLELEVERGFLSSLVEQACRDLRHAPFRAGDTLQLPYMHVHILAVRAGDPTRVRFELSGDPHGAPNLLIWEGRSLRPFRPRPNTRTELPALSLL